jgi:hypothetical protein
MAVGLLKIGKRIEQQIVLNQELPDLYVFSGSLDTNIYEDITSNENWVNVGSSMYDFMFCRNQVMSWTYVKTTVMGNPFSALTQSDQEYAAKVYAVGKPERESVYTQEELLGYWGTFISEASKTRGIRWGAAKALVSFELSVADSIDLAKSTNSLSNEYVTYGIEQFDLDGVDGLFDWLEDTAGFDGGTGFGGKSYHTTGLTENIMTILRDGIY